MVKKPVYYLPNLDAQIAAYMRKNRVSINQLASKIDLAGPSFCNKRNGKRNFSAPELLLLCHILGVSVDEVCMPDFLEQLERQETVKGKDGAALSAS